MAGFCQILGPSGGVLCGGHECGNESRGTLIVIESCIWFIVRSSAEIWTMLDYTCCRCVIRKMGTFLFYLNYIRKARQNSYTTSHIFH